MKQLERREVVDDVEEAESSSEREHDLVPIFRNSCFTGCVCKALREVFFDQVQIVLPGVEP